MSAMSNSVESATGISESVGFWLVLALVLVAATACAFIAAAYMPDAAYVEPFVGT